MIDRLEIDRFLDATQNESGEYGIYRKEFCWNEMGSEICQMELNVHESANAQRMLHQSHGNLESVTRCFE
jgi:hypothetical protein